jgi:hypothetical protein
MTHHVEFFGKSGLSDAYANRPGGTGNRRGLPYHKGAQYDRSPSRHTRRRIENRRYCRQAHRWLCG